MTNILITGSSRGMGLEWVRLSAARGWQVCATCRDPFEAGKLRTLSEHSDNISLHPLDVTDDGSVRHLARELDATPIDILVLNAGVWPDSDPTIRLGSIDYAGWEEAFRVNVAGAVRTLEALADQVASSEQRLVVGVSSDLGVISRIRSSTSPGYRAVCAALHAALRCVVFELRPRGVGLLLLHPGWVRTEMGGPGATLAPADSVAAMLERVTEYSAEQNGNLYTWDGRALPW